MRQINKALVFAKLTRLQGEARRLNLPISSPVLDEELVRRGFNLVTLRRSHDAHMRSLDNVIETFLRAGISTRLEQARSPLTSNKPPDEEDLVVSVGGDGTVLEAARYASGHTAFLGVNSDPEMSTGRLCTFAFHRHSTFDSVLHKLQSGNVSWLLRQRIGVKIIDGENNIKHVPIAALNEIFFAERDAFVPTKHTTMVENKGGGGWCLSDPPEVTSQHETVIQRSCGVIVCTGSGSTAWMRSASAVHYTSVKCTLATALGNNTQHHDLAKKTTRQLNDQCVFHPETKQVGYIVREPITPYQSTEYNLGPHRGFATKVMMRSLGYDIVLTMDGTFSINVPYGTAIEASINPDRVLKCVVLND